MLFLFNFFPLIRSFYRSVFLPSCLSFIPIFYFNFSPSFALFPFHSFSTLILYPHLLLIFYLLFPSIVVHSLTLSLLLFSCSLSLPLYSIGYTYISTAVSRVGKSGSERIWIRNTGILTILVTSASIFLRPG